MLRSILAGAAVLATVAGITASSAEASVDKNDPILVVHGFDGGGGSFGDLPLDSAVNCNGSVINDWVEGLEARGYTNVKTVGYYKGDTNCDINVPFRGDNTVDTSLREIGHDFATLVEQQFTDKGKNVGVSAHSMGGIVVRRALAGVQGNHSGFPDDITVSDVVTSGSPHNGASIASICGPGILSSLTPESCDQLEPGSAFLANLADNPQVGAKTDWTVIGGDCDEIVSGASAVDMARGSTSRPKVAKTRFAKPGFLSGGCSAAAGFDHSELVTKTAPLNRIDTGLSSTS